MPVIKPTKHLLNKQSKEEDTIELKANYITPSSVYITQA